MTPTCPRPSALLLAAVFGFSLLTSKAPAQQSLSAGVSPAVQLFATGVLDNAALAVDSRGDLLVTNYRRPGTVGRISPAQGASVLWELDSAELPAAEPIFLVGLAVDDDQRLLALDSHLGRLLRWNPGTEMVQVLAERYEGRRFDSLFAVAVDRRGNIDFAEPERSGTSGASGALYRYDVVTHRISPLSVELAQPTGLCLSLTGNQLFLAESGETRIVVWDLTAESAETARRSISVLKLLGVDDATEVGHLAHLTTDRRGWIYVALWDRGEVAVIDPRQETLLGIIPSNGRQVFGIALRHDALLMSVPEKEAIYSYDLRPLISRHAP